MAQWCATNAGAVTWGSATTGVSGTVSASNSLIGGTTSDQVGQVVTALTNGHYVVSSNLWDNPIGPVVNVGAVTWCNGDTAGPRTVGLVTASNSLIGGTAGDQVGGNNGGVIALTNGHYVAFNTDWDNPPGRKSMRVRQRGAMATLRVRAPWVWSQLPTRSLAARPAMAI